MWEPASAVCAPPQVLSVAVIKSSGGVATFHLFSPSLEVRGRRSNPSPPLSRFSRSIHLTSLSRPSTRTVARTSPSASIRRWSMLSHAIGRCYAAESTASGPAAAPRGSRSTAAPRARRVSSARSAVAARAIAGPAAAARAATWAGRAVGVLGRALRPLRSERRAISERCVPTCGADHRLLFEISRDCKRRLRHSVLL